MTAEHSLGKKARRFVMTGVLVTALHAVIAAGIIQYALAIPAIANTMAFIVATLVSYLVNTLWSFAKPLHGKYLFRFLTVSLVGCTLAYTVSGAAENFGLHYFVGIGLVAVTVPLVTFTLHGLWTYKD